MNFIQSFPDLLLAFIQISFFAANRGKEKDADFSFSSTATNSFFSHSAFQFRFQKQHEVNCCFERSLHLRIELHAAIFPNRAAEELISKLILPFSFRSQFNPILIISFYSAELFHFKLGLH